MMHMLLGYIPTAMGMDKEQYSECGDVYGSSPRRQLQSQEFQEIA